MKIIYSLITTLFLIGCSESFDEELGLIPTLIPRYLSVSPSVLNYSSAKSEQNVNVYSFQTPWKLENTINWISLSSLSGEDNALIKVGVSENLDADLARTAVFYLKSAVNDWTYESPISVTQEGAKPSISLSKNSFTFNGKNNSASVEVAANCKVTVRTSDDWINASYVTGMVNFSITSNKTENYRQGQIIVANKTESIKRIITINQAPASINASTESLVFNNNASEVDITVKSEANWTVSTSNSWINITPTSGNAGTSKIKISVSPNTSINERNGNVVLSVGGTQRIQIPVRQRGIFIEIEESEIQYKAAGGTETISVLSNTTWSVTSYPDWITLDKTKGEGNAILKATASDNPNTTSRSGQIHIQQEGLSIDCIVKVTQSGKIFEVDSTVLNFEDKSSTQSVNIESNGKWKAVSNNDWISVSPSSAFGNASLSISVTENTETNERKGSASVWLGDKTSLINVIQKGKYFTVDNTMLTYDSKGGSIKIAVSTNDTWIAEVEDTPSWLNLSASKGSGTAEITATAYDNASVNKRTAAIIIKTVNHQSVRILVTQKARYLTVDVNEVLFYFTGGDSEPITISTDGKYKIATSDSWFSTSLKDNILIVKAQKNTTPNPRDGYITIEMTDLVEGTFSLKLRVTQLNFGGSFIRKDFNPDDNYDKDCSTSGNLTITAYGDDMNWDSSSSSSTTLIISSYKSDINWDSSEKTGLTVNRTGYNEDKNHDKNSDSSGSMSREEYNEDKNHDKNSDSSGSMSREEYNEDKNHDKNSDSSGSMSREEYNEDKNLN